MNVASRLESHGISGTIQITRATYELIKEEFVCEPRGTVDHVHERYTARVARRRRNNRIALLAAAAVLVSVGVVGVLAVY